MHTATISKAYRIEAAHQLGHLPASHKCSHLHGHSYVVEVLVTGPIDPAAGWVRDFAELSEVVGPLVQRLDHANLNDVFMSSGWCNRPTTAENLCLWLLDRLPPWVSGVRVRETSTSCAEVFRS